VFVYLRDGVQQPADPLRGHIPLTAVVYLGIVCVLRNVSRPKHRPATATGVSEPRRYEAGAHDVRRFKHAACYKPEDEAKLRSVIHAGGEERFNDTIRDLSTLVHVVATTAAVH
jgi:hypothetical protein